MYLFGNFELLLQCLAIDTCNPSGEEWGEYFPVEAHCSHWMGSYSQGESWLLVAMAPLKVSPKVSSVQEPLWPPEFEDLNELKGIHPRLTSFPLFF